MGSNRIVITKTIATLIPIDYYFVIKLNNNQKILSFEPIHRFFKSKLESMDDQFKNFFEIELKNILSKIL